MVLLDIRHEPIDARSRQAGAPGSARVHSIGGLSGSLAPSLIGALQERTGSVHSALAVLAILPFAAMIPTLQIRRLQTAPAGR